MEQELSENNLLSTIARLGKEWRVTVEVNPEFQYPISRILNQACSTSKNLLSYIFFLFFCAETSNSPPGAWARDRQLPHRWDSFIFQQCCMFSELTMTLRRLARCRRLWSTAANTEVCGHWTSQLLQSPKGHLNVSPIPEFPSFASCSVVYYFFPDRAIWGPQAPALWTGSVLPIWCTWPDGHTAIYDHSWPSDQYECSLSVLWECVSLCNITSVHMYYWSVNIVLIVLVANIKPWTIQVLWTKNNITKARKNL